MTTLTRHPALQATGLQSMAQSLPPRTLDGCWRAIGVSGDRSCPELKQQIHCRNCPVYADAAQRNLQRAVEPGYRDAWARELGRTTPPPIHTDSAAMVFRVGAEWLAVPMGLMVEVAALAPVHRIPHRSGRGLLGIVNVGGRLLPAVALGQLLDIDTRDVPPALGRHAFARLLVLDVKGRRFALPVEEMHGVLRYAQSGVRAPASTVGRAPAPLLAGVVSDSAIEAGLLDGPLLEAHLEALLR